jgi:DNA-binding IclR family transcriptional regulator
MKARRENAGTTVERRDVARTYTVPALAQGLSILALFGRHQARLSAPEIAQKLSLPRATVFRLLQTLLTMGYLRRESDERQFSLGPALLDRGFEYLASLDLIEVSEPILRRLRDETGLSAHMAVREGREVVYVARFPARTTIASSVNIGTRFPVHATVMGRMTICECSDGELARLFSDLPLERFTEQTPVSMKALKALLAEDRTRGYAVSQSFFEHGVSSIAAPVRDAAGEVVAAINVTAIDAYIALPAMHGTLKDAVLAAAAEIGRWLCRGQPGDHPAGSPKAPSRPAPIRKTRRGERISA